MQDTGRVATETNTRGWNKIEGEKLTGIQRKLENHRKNRQLRDSERVT